jgi:hypothetical protein
MSSYFDAFRREVHTLSSAAGNDTEAFLKTLMIAEERIKNDCLSFAGDRETPDEVRQMIIACVALNEVRYSGGDFLGDDKGESKGTQWAAVARSSRLGEEMHSLWHDIAHLRLKPRYGLVMDNPEYAIQARDRHDSGKD